MPTTEAGRPYIAGGALMRRVINPLMVRFGLTTVLIVRGRRSGKLLRIPLGDPIEFEGARYLVTGRGETQWVRNLRAAGRAQLRRKGRTEDFRAVEITGPDQLRIVAAYREKLGSSVDRYFAEIPNPADHPVFRIDPA